MILLSQALITAGQVQMINQSPPTTAISRGGIALAQGSSASTGLATEIITNAVDRDFSGAGNWTLNTGITIAAGVMAFTAVGSAVTATLVEAFTNPEIQVFSTYRATFTVSGYVLGGVRIRTGNGTFGTTRSADGTYTEDFFVPAGSSSTIILQAVGASTTLNVDNVSVKLIPAGSLFVSNLGASAVPGTAVKLGGIAVSPAGMMYVTTDAPSGASFIGGFAVRSDGALHVSTSAVAGTDEYIGGIAVSSTGQVRVAIA
jgi:hypothetical protein